MHYRSRRDDDSQAQFKYAPDMPASFGFIRNPFLSLGRRITIEPAIHNSRHLDNGAVPALTVLSFEALFIRGAPESRKIVRSDYRIPAGYPI
jgi:hypothetical protein